MQQACLHVASDIQKTKRDNQRHDPVLARKDLRQVLEGIDGLKAFLSADQQRNVIGPVEAEYTAAIHAITDQLAGHLAAARREARKVEARQQATASIASLNHLCQ